MNNPMITWLDIVTRFTVLYFQKGDPRPNGQDFCTAKGHSDGQWRSASYQRATKMLPPSKRGQ